MTGKIPALVGCQIESCAAEVSYPLDMMKMLAGRPICDLCYAEIAEVDEDGDPKIDWDALPAITLADLK